MSRIESEALVVRTVEFGEADLVVTLVTEQAGKVAAIVRGARRGSRRVGGALEPVHTISVVLDDKGAELATLKEAQVVRARAGVTGSLEALDSAGVALRWARHAFPPRTPEPEGWRVLVSLLDVLDAKVGSPRRELARAGLGMLAALGYALDLERCVVCGRPCPPGKAACVRTPSGPADDRSVGMSRPRGLSTMLSASDSRMSSSTKAMATPKRLPCPSRAACSGVWTGRGVTYAMRRLEVYLARTSAGTSPTACAYALRKPRTNTSPGSSSKRSLSMASSDVTGMRVTRESSDTLIARLSLSFLRVLPRVGFIGS